MHLLHLSTNSRDVEGQQSVASTESVYEPQQPLPGSGQTNPQAQLPQVLSPYDPGHPQPPLHSSFSHPQAGFPNPTVTPTVTPRTKQASSAPGNPRAHEEAQLPTPETVMDQSNHDGYQPPYPSSNAMADMAKMPFSDFLQGVLYEQSLGEPSRSAEAQGLAVLDFCDDGNLELNDIDFGLLDHWNVDGDMQGAAPRVPDLQTNTGDAVDIATMRSKLVKVWTESPWRWSPTKNDNAYVEQTDLPLASKDVQIAEMQQINRVIKDKLHSSNRDKILALVLSICRSDSTMKRVAASFPSAEVMESWIHIFLASQLCQVSAWIHYGSFSLNEQWPEWLAIAAAAGAVLAPVPTLRRFGFALHEAVRLTIPSRFDENNTAITDRGLVQALMLVQDVALWSGNRRKMEIAECHLTIPIAMMRYRGKFQRSWYTVVVIEPSDRGKVLEQKWKKWYELEGWKRLVYHAFLRDSQVSMAQFCNPSISYAELTLPLPCPKDLWFARSAEEFKARYLETRAAEGKRAPCLGDLFRDIRLLAANYAKIDLQYAISIYLHGFWSLIWEYRQLSSVFRTSSQPASFQSSSAMLLGSRHQELCKQLHEFQLLSSDFRDMFSAQEYTVLHLLLMNLHVSLDDLQLFSGKEGEEQARRVYPRLQVWSGTVQAREALWHAGQILCQAKQFPTGHLKDFYAIAVQHAALCLWTFGVVTKATHRGPPALAPRPYEMVYLDGEDSPQIHQYLSLGTGRAAIRGPATRDHPAPLVESLLEDPRGCMDIAQEILRANFVGGHESLPPINENISHMLKQLANAAWAVGLG